MSVVDIANPRRDVAASPITRVQWRAHLLALSCYTLLALVATWPLVLHLTDSFAGSQWGAVDGFLGIWNVWWTARAISAGQNPFFTPLLFHPDGLDLFWQTLSLPQGLLAMPLTLAAGPLVAYNLLILGSFVLGGYTAFLFVRHISGSTPGALIGGAIYALAPFHLQKVVDAQLEVASIQWVPCYLLALHVLLERRRWPWALMAGGLLLWVGLGTFYYALFCLIYTGLAAGLWALGAGPWSERLRRFLWGLAPIAIWLLIMTPRLLSLVASGDQLLGEARNFNARSSADLISFWLPSPLHPLWGAAVSDFYMGLHPEAMLWNVSFGLVGLALAPIGIATTWRTHWRWLLLLVATMILAMGETLFVAGRSTGIPLPYMLLAGLPGVRASHRPNHIVVISILLMALFAAYGAAALLRRRPRQRWLLTAGLILAVLLVDGLAAPLPLVSRPIPAAYRNLGPADGALLPIPVNLNISRSEHLWYQTAHGWPIVGGFIGREAPYPTGVYTPGIRELRFGTAEPDDILTPGWPELARETLAAYRIRYVVFHPDTMERSLPKMRDLVEEMGLTPSYADEWVEFYPVPPVERPRPLAYLREGWSRLERDGGRRWRWMGERAEVQLMNPADQTIAVDLELHAESFLHTRSLTLHLDGAPLGAITVTRAEMRRHIKLLLPPGEHTLALTAPAEPAPERQDMPLSIAVLGITVRQDGPAVGP